MFIACLLIVAVFGVGVFIIVKNESDNIKLKKEIEEKECLIKELKESEKFYKDLYISVNKKLNREKELNRVREEYENVY